VDLCCAHQCVDSRITKREDLECAHEPSHRLIKVRTPVLTRNHGRAVTAACEAFQRVRELCTKIAESSSHRPKTTGLHEQQTPNSEPTSTEIPAKGDNQDDIHTALDCNKGGAETEDRLAPDTVQGLVSDQDLPTCGKCKSGLSFPFWYCIFCGDHLYICNACDSEGVPDLVRSSGRHTEDHHLIRCLAPENTKDKAHLTEDRLTVIEGRLDGMQTQLDDLTGRVGELNGTVGDLTSRIGNIEQLLHRLLSAGAPGNAA